MFPVLMGSGHHRASAGGVSISELQPSRSTPETPPGFSRISELQASRMLRNFLKRAVLLVVAEKLKYHRLKPGGVQVIFFSSSSCKIDTPPAEAWWCPKSSI